MLESIKPPAELRRIRLAAEFRKLPPRWSVICIRHDLHLYSEVEDARTLNSASGVYSELAKSHRIRLLHLLPDADDSSPTKCALQEVDQDQELPYEALSYV